MGNNRDHLYVKFNDLDRFTSANRVKAPHMTTEEDTYGVSNSEGCCDPA